MSLESLLAALTTTKAASALAGLSLAIGAVGVAGATVLDGTPADDTAVEHVEALDVDLPDAAGGNVGTASHGDTHGDGPNEEADARARAVYDFITGDHGLEGCEFGLGVAAIASDGRAPAAADTCETEATAGGGEDVSTAGADNASHADAGLGTAREEADERATVPATVPAGSDQGDEAAGEHDDTADAYRPSEQPSGPDDAPGGASTGDDARGDAGPPSS